MKSYRSRRRSLRRRHRAARGLPGLANKSKSLSFERLEDRCLLAGFDWIMTPRLIVDTDGRIAVPNNTAYANPTDGFEVVFDGTENQAGTYSWQVLYANQTAVSLPNVPNNQPIFRPKLKETDASNLSYTVKLSFTPAGSTTAQPFIENIKVNDILIVTMGDSLSAGEGNPEVPSRTDPEWMQVGDTTLYPPTPDSSPTGPVANTPADADVEQEQARYHEIASRSSWAAGAQMARQVEEADPHTSVTFVFVASSGASIGGSLVPGTPKPGVGGGALQAFAGQSAEGYDVNDPMPAQIDQVKDIVYGRSIDLMTFSFGVNDLAFTRIAKALALRPKGTFDSDFQGKLNEAVNTGTATAWDALRQSIFADTDALIEDQPVGLGLNGMAIQYNAFATQLATLPGHESMGVYMLEYPSPLTVFQNGQVVNASVLLDDVLPAGVNIDATEISWVDDRFMQLLNNAVATAANAHAAEGWKLVSGISADFAGHGYAVPDDERWIRTATEGNQIQGPNNRDTTATLHPNRRGQADIAKRLTDQVVADLFAKNVFKASELNQQTLLNEAHAYFDKIISSPLEVPSIKTLGDSLNNLIDFNSTLEIPGVGNTISEVVDLDSLLNEVLGKLGEELKVESTLPLLTFPINGTQDLDDASFMVTVDDRGTVNIRLPLSAINTGTLISYTTPAMVEDALNQELEAAGLTGLVIASIQSGKLVFTAPSANSLTVTTLQVRAASPGPPTVGRSQPRRIRFRSNVSAAMALADT